ncbi:hypothetical protein [Paraburkholderia terrae]|uniref:hypothetical protein n=1 Tax=Paraburkholderia terrae TaxID=311230 RepID=UPI001EE273D5|nr:hypothetical protein [Paraburkholderia terrae]GJH04616.1 hypothetical protein CBA19C8_28685 [Paraburkholderia terrae]
MTRDEINVAVNKAFDSNVWSIVGSLTINIETVPKRQLVLADALVEQLLSGAIGPKDFDAALREARDATWTPNKDGSLTFLLNC